MSNDNISETMTSSKNKSLIGIKFVCQLNYVIGYRISTYDIYDLIVNYKYIWEERITRT